MEQTVKEFISGLKQLDEPRVHGGANEIRSHLDEVALLRATMAIDQAVRREGRLVEAAGAARAATDAVVTSAVAHGLPAEHPDVACVSQRAAEVARGLVVGGVVLSHLGVLLRGWQDTLPFQMPAATRITSGMGSWWSGWWNRTASASDSRG